VRSRQTWSKLEHRVIGSHPFCRYVMWCRVVQMPGCCWWGELERKDDTNDKVNTCLRATARSRRGYLSSYIWSRYIFIAAVWKSILVAGIFSFLITHSVAIWIVTDAVDNIFWNKFEEILFMVNDSNKHFFKHFPKHIFIFEKMCPIILLESSNLYMP
jgi:hypothetical protein